MGKLVLSHRPDSIYDDLPEQRYHFPGGPYLKALQSAVGDWAIYYAPGVGRRSYFATVKIAAIRADLQQAGLFYADMEERTFLEFDRSVPMVEGTQYYESKLQNANGTTNMGAVQRAARYISDHEFNRIVAAGFARVIQPSPGWQAEEYLPTGVAEEPATWDDRPIIERLTQRPFRDSAFRKRVRDAYDNTCAITGLRLINGGGRPEVAAAHIRPVEHAGPDSVRNGLALSGTAHWMFDRGLISVADDLTVLTAEKYLPATVKPLIEAGRSLWLPSDPSIRPHPQFLRYHREAIFKG